MTSRTLIEKTKKRLRSEIGAVRKPHANRLRIALAFPNTYYLGMSSLGFQTVYRLLNELDEVVCERVFFPDDHDVAEFERSAQPLFSMESQTPLRDFDVIAFSLPFELDYPKVVRMLALSGIEVLARHRDAVPGRPLIIAGGAAATFNPEPMAPFVDAFVVGEAEGVLHDLMAILLVYHRNTEAILSALALVPAVYVPRFYEPEYGSDGTLERMEPVPGVPSRVSRTIASPDNVPAVSQILTPETEFSNMILAEVSRGCGRRCRFCVAGHIYLPPRPCDPQAVLAGIAHARDESAPLLHYTPRVGLVSASLFDHPGSLVVCDALAENGIAFSISSTRTEGLDSRTLELLRRGGHETLTVAPEAGTERLRQVLNKPLADESLRASLDTAWECGFRRVKLYFMVGLPTETEEDVEAVVSLVTDVASRHAWRKLTVSLACFVPKPWTPFQWAAMNTSKQLAEKIAVVRKSLKGVRSVSVSAESPREAVVQGVLARGDRRLEAALLSVAQEGIGWRSAFTRTGIQPEFYAHRVRFRDEVFPWDHLDLGVERSALWRGYSACCASPESEDSRSAAR